MTPEEFGEVFRSFERDAFRLETLSRYDVGGEDEKIRRFLAGESRPEPDEAKRGWLGLIRSSVDVGKRMHRVHLIRGALTDYLRWEIEWGYPPNAEAGEKIGILQVGEKDLPELGNEDFWLFDDRLAVLMQYGPEGQWLGQVAAEEPAVIVACQRKRDIATTLAVTLDDYLRKVGAV